MNSPIQALVSSNPEDRAASSPTKPSSSPQQSSDLVDSLLSRNELTMAQQVSQGKPWLQAKIHTHLFYSHLLKVLSLTDTDQLKICDRSDQRMSPIEQKIVEMAVRLKGKKSLNTSLVNMISSMLNDIVVGKKPNESSNKKGQISKKIQEPLLKIYQMLQMSQTERQIQIKKEACQQREQFSQLQEESNSLKRANEALMKKEKLSNQKIMQLKHQLEEDRAKSIMLKQALNQQFDTLSQEKKKVEERYRSEIDQLKLLISKHANSELIHSQISKIIKEMKEHLTVLAQQKQLPLEERNEMISQLMNLQLLINRELIEAIKHSNEDEEKKREWELMMEEQKIIIDGLQNTILQLQQYQTTPIPASSDLQAAPKVEQISKERETLKAAIEELTDQNKVKQVQINRFNVRVQKLQAELESLRQKVPQSQQNDGKTEQLLKQLSEKEVQLDLIQSEKQQLLKTHSGELKKRTDKIASLEKRLKQKDEEISAHQKSKQSLNLVISDMKELHTEEIQALKITKQKLEEDIKALSAQNASQSESKAEQGKTEEIKAEETKEQKTIEQIREEEAQNSQNEELVLQIQSLQGQLQQMREKMQDNQKMLDFHKNKQRQSDQKFNLANRKLKSLMAAQNFKNMLPKDYVQHFFNGQILDQNIEQKMFLRQALENKFKTKLFKTKLLYKYDPLVKINFHQYIDHKEGIFVLVKLVNQQIIAGFYQGKLAPKMVADKEALLISVTNKEVFELIEPNKRGTNYDDYYFVLGSSELRVKSGDKMFFSNFGIANSSFKSRGHKVSTITGCNDREVQFESLQFYQATFY